VTEFRNTCKNAHKKRQKGFSLLELMVSVAILVIVAGSIIMGMIRMTWSESTIMNRTQMHSSVRNATELMQQEVGQAGKLGFQPGLQFTTAIAAPGAATPTITTTAATGNATDAMYLGEQLVVDPSTTSEETVTITALTATSITATFVNSHLANVPVLVMGGLASGIVPPTTASTAASSMLVLDGNNATGVPINTTLTTDQASNGSTLKMYGDLNGDGTTYYVAYKCTQDVNGNGTLYRYVSNTSNVLTATGMQTGTLLLDHLGQNPNSAPCFTYQVKQTTVTFTGGSVNQTFVINVAVTLTVQTQNKDLQTNAPQFETKALLNIAPRNVFEAWELASSPSGYTRAQPMPHNVVSNLLSATLQ
jgi:prepilin-type N-terminal cleavage/methylation domain-containing protein